MPASTYAHAVLLAALVAAHASACVTVQTHGERPRARGDRAGQSAKPIARQAGFATAADGTRIYYEKLGSGPPVAFVHGLGGNVAVWYKQAPQFARDHTVILLSQRGFAPSEGARDRFDVSVLADDLLRVLDAAGVDRANVVGQSMGGWTALRFAMDHPDRVNYVVLADTVGGISDEKIRANYEASLARARELAARTPPLGEHPALDPAYSRAHPDEAYLYQLLAAFGSPSPGVIAQQLGNTIVKPDELKHFNVPVLFVVGKRDPIFPPAIIQRAASYVRGSRVATIEGAGHSPYLETPETWNRIVREFIGSEAARKQGAKTRNDG